MYYTLNGIFSDLMKEITNMDTDRALAPLIANSPRKRLIDADSYELIYSLPGRTSKDIDVNVEGPCLVVKAPEIVGVVPAVDSKLSIGDNEVASADMNNGLLVVKIQKPESKKSKKISIGSSQLLNE